MDDEAELVALRRRVRELEALEAVARAARTPIELDEALAALVESAAGSLHAEVCALAVASTRGARSEIAFRSSQAGPTDDDLYELAALAPYAEAGRLAVPLPTRRGARGALVAWRSRPGAFSAREQELAEAAAAHAATVLAGARGAMRGLFAREVHHRVKNNLQTVASLLRLAANGGADPERALRDSIGRVLAIAEVHDLLTEQRDEDVDSADLVRRLCGMLRSTLDGTLEAGPLAPIVLAPERATALALVLCELAANAIEHGGGHGSVELRRDGAFVELTVSDHGQGPAPPPGTPGQGLSIARALVEVDLGGSLRFEQDGGVRATVRFPFMR
jgi:two-component sensor histidine kinase